jgi:hypothetical protein
MSELSSESEWKRVAPATRQAGRSRADLAVLVFGIVLWCSIAAVLGLALLGSIGSE